MTAAPRLLAGKRRELAAMLAVLALGEAVVAVLFAAAIDRLLAHAAAPAIPALAAAGLALMAGLTLLATRWVGEDFAQYFVTDCRAALFEAVTRAGSEGGDARWLTVLINDMAALRNYALRGSVRLWTSVLSASAAAGWVLITMPTLRPALIPLAFGAGAIILLTWPLTRAITAQRSQRGRLNRFLVRRVRAELTGEPSAKGHGFRKLAVLSGDMARLSVKRAVRAGAMDGLAMAAGLAAALLIVWQALGQQGAAGLAGSLTLFGFIAARLLESARALHARIAGRIALRRLAQLLDTGPAQRRPRAKPRTRIKARPRPRWFWQLRLPGRAAATLLPPPSQSASKEPR